MFKTAVQKHGACLQTVYGSIVHLRRHTHPEAVRNLVSVQLARVLVTGPPPTATATATGSATPSGVSRRRRRPGRTVPTGNTASPIRSGKPKTAVGALEQAENGLGVFVL